VLKYRVPHGSLAPREQLCNRYCSNKHKHPECFVPGLFLVTFCTLCLGTEAAGVSVPLPLSLGRPQKSMTVTGVDRNESATVARVYVNRGL
jgi:hypothetical protein